MNKKTILKMGLLMLIGGIIGGVVSIGLFFVKDGMSDVFRDAADYILSVSPFLYPILLVTMFIPSVYLALQGKKYLLISKRVSEDEIDEYEKKSDKYFEPAMTLNSVFMLMNFLIIGTTYQAEISSVFVVLCLFMLNAILASAFEIILVRFIQKHDERLKGDPTSLKFQKDFLASLDEAEKLRIYKSGYEAFQLTRNFTFGVIVTMILLNMVVETGALPVAVACIIGFSQVISFQMYNSKNLKHK